jgi:hypothetical protein
VSLEKERQRGDGINHGSGMRIPEAGSANEDKTRNCVKKDGKQNSVTTTNYITLHYITLFSSLPVGSFQ